MIIRRKLLIGADNQFISFDNVHRGPFFIISNGLCVFARVYSVVVVRDRLDGLINVLN